MTMSRQDVRTERVPMYLTAAEKSTLRAIAEQTGTPLSGALRLLILEEARRRGIVGAEQRKAER